MMTIRTVCLFTVCLALTGPRLLAADETPRVVPAEFRLIGSYELTKRIKVRAGEAFPIAINAIRYEVFTDGITVRCYAGEGEAFTSFEIYRRDGVAVARKAGLVESIPGIQAKTLVGDVLRQLSLTEERMILSRFPAKSDIMEVTYALRTREELQR